MERLGQLQSVLQDELCYLLKGSLDSDRDETGQQPDKDGDKGGGRGAWRIAGWED